MVDFVLDSVVKYYNNKIVLNDIYIELDEGNILGIFGKNGAGKTTLLNIICGIESCSYKFLKYKNKVYFDSQLSKIIAYSSQKIFIPKNVRIKTLFKIFNPQNFEKLLSDNIIGKNLNQKFKYLSYGEKFYLQLLFVINSSKAVCVLDEPFASLSPIYIQNIIHYINICSKNKIFIITDHNIEKLFEISTRKMFLKKGKLIEVSDKTLEDVRGMYLSI